MPTPPTAKLQIPIHDDTDVVSTTTLNDPFNWIDGVVQHHQITKRPFDLVSFAMAGPNIVLTFGPGRTYFGPTLVEKNSNAPPLAQTNWTYTIPTAAAGTLYWVYLLPTGLPAHNTTGITPAGAVPLYQIQTNASAIATTSKDLRSELGGPQTLGSLSAPGFTQGSVLFVGPAETIAQDNANFRYDDPSNQLYLAALRVGGAAQFDGPLYALQRVSFQAGDAAAELVYGGSGVVLATGVLAATTTVRGAQVQATTVVPGQQPLVIASQQRVVNLNADMTDGIHVGNAAGQIGWSNGAVNVGFVAEMIAGSGSSAGGTYRAGNEAGKVPLSNSGVNATLNADMLDNFHADSNPTASTVLLRDGAGYAHAVYYEGTAAMAAEGGVPAGLMGVNGSNGYFRRYAPLSVLGMLLPIDGAGSLLDADMVDGYHAGNASGQVAVANGTVVTNLNAHYVQGMTPQYPVNANSIPVRDGNADIGARYFYSTGAAQPPQDTLPAFVIALNGNDSYYRHYSPRALMNMLCYYDGAGSGLDADTVDTYNPGNAPYNIPINDGRLMQNLNANYVQSWDIAAFQSWFENTSQSAAQTPNDVVIPRQAYADCPNCILTAPQQAWYMITGTFWFVGDSNTPQADEGALLQGFCRTPAGFLDSCAICRVTQGDGGREGTNGTYTVVWITQLAAGWWAKLQVYKDSGTGASLCRISHTRITMVKLRNY